MTTFCEATYSVIGILAVFEWIFFLFFFFAVPFYIVFLVFLWQSRGEDHLKSAFFKLCITVGIADLLTLMINLLGWKAAYYGWLRGAFLRIGDPAAWAIFLGHDYVYRCRDIGVIALCVNRFTAVVLPTKHEQIWQRYLKPTIWAQFTMPLLIGVLPKSLVGGYYFETGFDIFGPNVSAAPMPRDLATYSKYIITWDTMLFSGRVVLYFALFAAILVALCFRQKKSSNRDTSEMYSEAQLKLSLCAFVVICFDLAALSYQLLKFAVVALSNDGNVPPCFLRIFFVYMNTISDVYGWINPWVVLSTSSVARAAFVGWLKPGIGGRVANLPGGDPDAPGRIVRGAAQPRNVRTNVD